jgi:hypothetical protein
MAVWRIVGDHLEPVEGVVLTAVHPRDRCEGRPCVVHAPTDHPMRSWPLNWRNDRVMFERICPHGIGHPDPDQFARWAELLDPEEAVAEGIHGCDGCCATGRGADSPQDVSDIDLSATEPPTTSEAAGDALSAPDDPAARLRSAADELEQTAATTRAYVVDPWAGHVRDTLVPWVALMSPDLAAPLAAWLRERADYSDAVGFCNDREALNLAAAILGGAA